MSGSDLKELMRLVSIVFEVSGVVVIVAGFAWAVFRAAVAGRAGADGLTVYQAARSVFGRSILLGLEVLVAADLIRTVAVDPTLGNLYSLGLLILIRTLLSFSLDVEIEGAWPWDKRRIAASGPVSGDGPGA